MLLNLALKALEIDGNKVIRDVDKTDKTFKNLSKSKKLKNEKCKNLTNIKAINIFS